LAATLHVLRNKCLTLLSPATWDDRNDAFFLSEFKKQTCAKSVLALCFAEAAETYHHWRVFSHGSDGACIEFEKPKLEEALGCDARITFRSVNYMTIPDARASGVAIHELPFVKRYAYRDEIEFRAVLVDIKKDQKFVHVPISLECITRVTLSPWMTQALVDTVKLTLRSIKGCTKLKVYRSTLIENENWMRLASPKPHP
jgi:hypothetical protein